jgi:tellurite resistance protein TehA-like permease
MHSHGAERNEVSFVVRAILAIFAAAGFAVYLAVMAVIALPMLLVVILRAVARAGQPVAVAPIAPTPTPVLQMHPAVVREREHARAA